MPKLTGKFIGFPVRYDVKPPGADGKIWTVQNGAQGKFGFTVNGIGNVIPRDGFLTDFASIPRIAWRIIGPPTGYGAKANYGPAAVIHDVCYVTKMVGDIPITRKQADQIMLAAMVCLNVSKWRRNMMYAVLRMFGRKHFGRKETAFP